jgi:hypothetical protein
MLGYNLSETIFMDCCNKIAAEHVAPLSLHIKFICSAYNKLLARLYTTGSVCNTINRKGFMRVIKLLKSFTKLTTCLIIKGHFVLVIIITDTIQGECLFKLIMQKIDASQTLK